MKIRANHQIHPEVLSAMAEAFGGLPFLRDTFSRANQPIKVSLEESKAKEVIALASNPEIQPSIRHIFGGMLKWTGPERDKRSKEPGEARIYFCIIR